MCKTDVVVQTETNGSHLIKSVRSRQLFLSQTLINNEISQAMNIFASLLFFFILLTRVVFAWLLII